jgi:hypothetical protein
MRTSSTERLSSRQLLTLAAGVTASVTKPFGEAKTSLFLIYNNNFLIKQLIDRI